jgi:hypothetical protein
MMNTAGPIQKSTLTKYACSAESTSVRRSSSFSVTQTLEVEKTDALFGSRDQARGSAQAVAVTGDPTVELVTNSARHEGADHGERRPWASEIAAGADHGFRTHPHPTTLAPYDRVDSSLAAMAVHDALPGGSLKGRKPQILAPGFVAKEKLHAVGAESAATVI